MSPCRLSVGPAQAALRQFLVTPNAQYTLIVEGARGSARRHQSAVGSSGRSIEWLVISKQAHGLPEQVSQVRGWIRCGLDKDQLVKFIDHHGLKTPDPIRVDQLGKTVRTWIAHRDGDPVRVE